MADGRNIIGAVVNRDLARLRAEAADGVRGGINGVLRDGVQVAREGLKRLIEGAGSLFPGGKGDEIKDRIGAAVAVGATVVATTGTVVGDVKMTAEKAADRVAGMAVDVAGATQNFVANAATVTAPIAAGAEPAPSGERKVSEAEFFATPTKDSVTIGVTSGVTPKSDFNSAAPGEQLPALKALMAGEELGGERGRFDNKTYKNARDYVMGIEPPGMG